MRKLLFLPLILITAYLIAADGVTVGPMFLLKPSTSTPDPNRNAGDKLNSNFDIIASSVSVLFTGVASTATLYTQLTSTSVSLSNLRTQVNSSMTIVQLTLATATIVGLDEGTPQSGGQLSALNFTGAGIAFTQSNGTGTVTVSATGMSNLNGATFTAILKVPNVIMSTITPYGIPGAYFSAVTSTYTIYSWSAFCINPSTVGWVKFDALISTGGLSGLPLAPSRFLPISLSTGSSGGLAGFGQSGSTTVVLGAGETFGVGVSSIAVIGNPGAGCSIRLRLSESAPFP